MRIICLTGSFPAGIGGNLHTLWAGTSGSSSHKDLFRTLNALGENQQTITTAQEVLHVNAATARNRAETTSRGDTDGARAEKDPSNCNGGSDINPRP